MRTDTLGEHPSGTVRFGVLGPLTVHVDGHPLPLGPLKQQQVLAMLLCQANSVTSVDQLTDTLWGDEPPRTARKNLQVYIACLRKLLRGEAGTDRLVHRTGGYLLRATAEELDLLQFQAEVARARELADPAARSAGLAEALQLWRGRMLDGLTSAAPLAVQADRGALRYLSAFEDWADGELALGHGAAVVERLCELAGRFPFRERLRQLQMTALYRVGRQAEALSVFDELRLALARELGLQPSPATERLYRSMLSGEPAQRPAARPAPRPDRPRVVLPPDLEDFTGRAAAVAELDRWQAGGHCRLALVSGPVGIGKTSLAVRAAYRAEPHFPDGRIFLGLRNELGHARSRRSVLTELLRVAGESGLEGCDTEELAGRWQSWLMDRRVLLVLDDACDSAVLHGVLPLSGTSAVLATTRRRLAGLEYATQIELSAMAPAEAVCLLGRVIGDDRIESDPAAAARIVQAIGLSPLAVRTAGSKLRVLRHVSLVEFAGRLQHPDQLLDELCMADSGLRSRLAAGLSDLPERERDALQRLGSSCTARFTLEEAVPVVAEMPGRVRRLIESLIEANAVTVPVSEVSAAAVYELPRLLRCYVRELAAG
ncbi:MAG TPA: BTAD domain-containing putative transcriptional regulator [Jatrophihabitans sp.]|nr:BTAD domain-containing putative transcriptional regulator [Jatrophihabitans sp.]